MHQHFIKRASRLTLGVVAAAVLAVSTVLPAVAVEETGVTITGGSLSGGGLTFGNFSAITLDGTAKTATASWAIANAVDGRGTGAGWNLSLTLTPLAEWSGAAYIGAGAKVLPTDAVRVTTSPSVSLADAGSSAANTVTPIGTTTSIASGSPVKLLTVAADVDAGMGSYAFTNLVATLTVPAGTKAATYKSNATVSLSTGP
jgi:hypothetical protein